MHASRNNFTKTTQDFNRVISFEGYRIPIEPDILQFFLTLHDESKGKQDYIATINAVLLQHIRNSQATRAQRSRTV
jgi:hypothetical protein